LQTEIEQLQGELKTAEVTHVEVPMTIRLQGEGAQVTIDGHTQTVAAGQWSDFFRMTFELNPLLHVKAITRVKLVHASEPHFELYVNALEIDPESPPFWQPISQPHGFAKQLAGRVGLFETVGWACMNLPLKDQVVDAETFLEDIQFTLEWRERMTFDALARDDWRMLMSCFSTPDRLQHMIYQYLDPEHPLYDPQAAARRMTFFGEEIALSDAIPAIYRQADRLVGRVLAEHVRPGDTLIVCSDHGFQSFRRQVHMNNWLVEHGFLALKPGIRRKDADFLAFVDWSRTEAYALGLGMVYVNQKGREKAGIVEPDRVREVMDRIRAAWVASKDPESGAAFGEEAYVVADIHAGAHIDREADMLLTFKPGYRISWGTTTGGLSVDTDESGEVVPAPTCSDNDKTWSGDHVTVDPRWVQGILFSNRKLAVPVEGADLRHVAPTVLALLGVSIPEEYDLPQLGAVP
jgi:predicted AlkP superfamily phosphohydrolase/phosphomutase